MIFEKTHPDAKMPVRSTRYSAGLDIFANETVQIHAGRTAVIKTGLTFHKDLSDEPDKEFIGLYVRSSLAVGGILLANGVGVIDFDYEGKEVMVILHNTNMVSVTIRKGEKIAQLIKQRHWSGDAKNVTFKYTERTGGLGSTD